MDADDGHGRIRVFLATDKQVPDLRNLAGITYPQTREIFINVSESKSHQDMIVCHEACHNFMWRTPFLSHAAEERAVSRMAPKMWAALRRHGLRWPPRPSGYLALKRSAS